MTSKSQPFLNPNNSKNLKEKTTKISNIMNAIKEI